MAKKLPPLHPGEILREDSLRPLNMTAYELAKRLGVSALKIYDMVKEKRGVTADTALRLGKLFGQNPQFWLNLQSAYELECEEDRLMSELDKIQELRIS